MGGDMLDITGPAIFARSFLEYFHYKLPIQEGTYPNQVRLLRQDLRPLCRLYTFVDLDLNTTIIINKYPKYIEDMQVYNDQPSYGELYR